MIFHAARNCNNRTSFTPTQWSYLLFDFPPHTVLQPQMLTQNCSYLSCPGSDYVLLFYTGLFSPHCCYTFSLNFFLHWFTPCLCMTCFFCLLSVVPSGSRWYTSQAGLLMQPAPTPPDPLHPQANDCSFHWDKQGYQACSLEMIL